MKKILALIITAVLLLPCVAFAASASGDADVTDEFTDPAFREVVLSFLGKKEDGRITESEAAGIKSITVMSEEVVDLSGIGYLTSLERLYVQCTGVTALDLSANGSLETLVLTDDPGLTELSLSGPALLTGLMIERCENLTSLSITGMPSLTRIEVNENKKLANLTLSDLPALRYVDCSKNALTSLTLSLPALEVLNCEENLLASLDLSGCEKINSLSCTRNSFTETGDVIVPDDRRSIVYGAFYDGPISSNEVIFTLDTENEAVLSMSLCYAYVEDPATTRGWKVSSELGAVSEFCETLGISFPVVRAEMLNDRYTESVDGRYIPTEQSNNCFCVKFRGITVEEAIWLLLNNPYVKNAEPNFLYSPEVPVTPPTTFNDVGKGDWFYDNVEYVYKKGLMMGVGNNVFSPDGTVTRAMTVTVIYRLGLGVYGEYLAEKSGPDSGFLDVQTDSWYADALNWAKSSGVVFGKTETEFDPDGAVTRSEFAAMLMRFFDLVGGSESWKMNDLHPGESPADYDIIPDYAKGSVLKLFSAEVIKGRPGGKFDPFATITRAEVAAMIERFTKAIEAKAE